MRAVGVVFGVKGFGHVSFSACLRHAKPYALIDYRNKIEVSRHSSSPPTGFRVNGQTMVGVNDTKTSCIFEVGAVDVWWQTAAVLKSAQRPRHQVNSKMVLHVMSSAVSAVRADSCLFLVHVCCFTLQRIGYI